MFHLLLYRLRGSPIVERLAATGRMLRYHWLGWRDGNLLFTLLVLLPLVAFAAFARFAYVDHRRSAAERQRNVDLHCLARNIYHEARGEPLAGQQAVAEVTMNRVASPLYPDTVCAVVMERRWDPKRGRLISAFSWTELAVVEEPRGVAWRRAASTAQAVYDRRHEPRVSTALHYHATRITPYWAEGREPLATIGRHVFYE